MPSSALKQRRPPRTTLTDTPFPLPPCCRPSRGPDAVKRLVDMEIRKYTRPPNAGWVDQLASFARAVNAGIEAPLMARTILALSEEISENIRSTFDQTDAKVVEAVDTIRQVTVFQVEILLSQLQIIRSAQAADQARQQAMTFREQIGRAHV